VSPVGRNAKQATERETSMRIDRAIVEIERVSAWLEAFAVSAGVPQAMTADMLVAMDEVLNNIIRHGSRAGEGGSGTIQLDLRIGSQRMELTVTDDGQAFDPTLVAPPRTGRSPGEERLGGVGLLFVQSLTDEIRYSRLNGCNRLILCKRLPAPAS
jgi:serine/threonine-protein kinase RsbW